jgi:hypothetical protein
MKFGKDIGPVNRRKQEILRANESLTWPGDTASFVLVLFDLAKRVRRLFAFVNADWNGGSLPQRSQQGRGRDVERDGQVSARATMGVLVPTARAPRLPRKKTGIPAFSALPPDQH